jgi:hypothetical protein
VYSSESRPPDWFALTGAGATVALHLVLQAQGPNPFLIIGACLFWAGYVIVRVWQSPGILREWGFRGENLWPTTAIALGLFVLIAGSFALYALFRGTFQFPAHTLLLMMSYPFWGVIQQFLALSIVVQNLTRIRFLDNHWIILVFLSAILFSLVHLHDGRELVGTFCLELILIPIFLRYRNLWPLGVLHGWIGGLFYLWVMDRDLWTANFGTG